MTLHVYTRAMISTLFPRNKLKMKNMSDRLNNAVSILRDGDYTLAVIHGDCVYTSKERGVKPLLELYEQYGDLCGAIAADKVVGKAAALLYVRLGVAELYTDVISTHALAVLKDNGIDVLYSVETDAIRNRRGDGFCPMETAVMDISDPDSAIAAIYATLKALNQRKD